jgi:hypothetical protein
LGDIVGGKDPTHAGSLASSPQANEPHGKCPRDRRNRADSPALKQHPVPTPVREAACPIGLSVHNAITYNKSSATSAATNRGLEPDRSSGPELAHGA